MKRLPHLFVTLLEPIPLALAELASIDESGRIDLPPIEAACDVDNPLIGPNGAAHVGKHGTAPRAPLSRGRRSVQTDRVYGLLSLVLLALGRLATRRAAHWSPQGAQR